MEISCFPVPRDFLHPLIPDENLWRQFYSMGFYWTDALPTGKPAVSEHWRQLEAQTLMKAVVHWPWPSVITAKLLMEGALFVLCTPVNTGSPIAGTLVTESKWHTNKRFPYNQYKCVHLRTKISETDRHFSAECISTSVGSDTLTVGNTSGKLK